MRNLRISENYRENQRGSLLWCILFVSISFEESIAENTYNQIFKTGFDIFGTPTGQGDWRIVPWVGFVRRHHLDFTFQFWSSRVYSNIYVACSESMSNISEFLSKNWTVSIWFHFLKHSAVIAVDYSGKKLSISFGVSFDVFHWCPLRHIFEFYLSNSGILSLIYRH